LLPPERDAFRGGLRPLVRHSALPDPRVRLSEKGFDQSLLQLSEVYFNGILTILPFGKSDGESFQSAKRVFDELIL
jgi:hypothetical protein